MIWFDPIKRLVASYKAHRKFLREHKHSGYTAEIIEHAMSCRFCWYNVSGEI